MEFRYIRSLVMGSRATAGMSTWLKRWLEAVLVVTWSFAIPLWAWSAPPPKQAQSEVIHLLNYLDQSGCEFFRNGTWHDAHEAKNHLEMKYTYLANKNLVRSADDFIARAATVSSVSGQAYQVRCNGGAAVSSADWLRAELSRFPKTANPTER
jgi:hypothetical protein